MVAIVGPGGEEVARGIVNYSSHDASKMIGKHSGELANIASTKNYDALITRDDGFYRDYFKGLKVIVPKAP